MYSSTYACLIDCDSGFSTDLSVCLAITGCTTGYFKQLMASYTYQCLENCPNNIVTPDNVTCSSEVSCSGFRLSVSSQTYQCLSDCPSYVSDASKLCQISSTCSPTASFKELVANSTYQCVSDCSLALVTFTNQLFCSLISCNVTAFK